MESRRSAILAAGAILLGAMAFFSGRAVEERAIASQQSARAQKMSSPVATKPSDPSTYRELAAIEILALPFSEFYEALRSAPSEARKKWADELQAMPAGPRRTAALAAFYKLLVQFDPLSAAESACEVKDKDARELALESVAGAAPGFALKDIATLFLKLPADASDYRKYLEEVISEWISIDPPAVAQFYDEHPEITEHGLNRELIRSWAAIDPGSAKAWLDANGRAGGEITEFIMGWYLNDSRAATDYAIQHAEELAPTAGLGELLSALYLDSKEEAKKFIEQLPNDELRNNAFRAFEFAVKGTADETGEPDRTPRAVADWMTQFPSAYWRGHLSHVLSYWNAGPPQEVLSWIEQQPAEIQEAVAAEYEISAKDVVKSVTAVFQVARPDLRDRLLAAMFQHSLGSTWKMKDEIKESSLPAEQKQHVLAIAAKVEKDEEAAREERARAENDKGREK